MGCRVKGPAKIPALSPGFLGLPLVLLHSSFVDHAGKVEKLSAHSRLAGVNVPDEDDVKMPLDWVLRVIGREPRMLGEKVLTIAVHDGLLFVTIKITEGFVICECFLLLQDKFCVCLGAGSGKVVS